MRNAIGRVLVLALAASVATGQNSRPARVITRGEPPSGLVPGTGLSAADRSENFEALWQAIDTTYACFQLKGIDWKQVGERYRARLDGVTDDVSFYQLLFQLVNELKDTHSWLQNYRMPLLVDVSDVALDIIAGIPYVVAVRPGSAAERAGVAPGWEVVAVDGAAPAARIEALRPRMKALSSERAFQREAMRHLLAGETAGGVEVKFRARDGAVQTVRLARGGGPRARLPEPQPGFELTRQRFVHYGRHPSGVGYIRIESFGAHEEVADEFDRALETLRDAPGLLLDIRDNPGGFGQSRIVGRLLSKRALTGIAYIKTGPGHKQLARRESYIEPAGPWQYNGPVALLVNAGTGSASDLFACELRSARRATLVGSTSHGNLSGVAAYVVLPCGLVVRVSNGYIADAHDRPVEGSGNVPDVAVEPSLADVLGGRDVVMERAVAEAMAHVRRR